MLFPFLYIVLFLAVYHSLYNSIRRRFLQTQSTFFLLTQCLFSSQSPPTSILRQSQIYCHPSRFHRVAHKIGGNEREERLWGNSHPNPPSKRWFHTYELCATLVRHNFYPVISFTLPLALSIYVLAVHLLIPSLSAICCILNPSASYMRKHSRSLSENLSNNFI